MHIIKPAMPCTTNRVWLLSSKQCSMLNRQFYPKLRREGEKRLCSCLQTESCREMSGRQPYQSQARHILKSSAGRTRREHLLYATAAIRSFLLAPFIVFTSSEALERHCPTFHNLRQSLGRGLLIVGPLHLSQEATSFGKPHRLPNP